MDYICFVGSELIDALRDLHEIGYIHRDISSSNVMIENIKDIS